MSSPSTRRDLCDENQTYLVVPSLPPSHLRPPHSGCPWCMQQASLHRSACTSLAGPVGNMALLQMVQVLNWLIELNPTRVHSLSLIGKLGCWVSSVFWDVQGAESARFDCLDMLGHTHCNNHFSTSQCIWLQAEHAELQSCKLCLTSKTIKSHPSGPLWIRSMLKVLEPTRTDAWEVSKCDAHARAKSRRLDFGDFWERRWNQCVQRFLKASQFTWCDRGQKIRDMTEKRTSSHVQNGLDFLYVQSCESICMATSSIVEHKFL